MTYLCAFMLILMGCADILLGKAGALRRYTTSDIWTGIFWVTAGLTTLIIEALT